MNHVTRDARCCAALVSLLALGVSTRALAQEQAASAGDVALARSLAAEGIQLADQGNCAAAIDKLQRAETLYHAPTILGRLGECQVATGKVVAGSENLQKVVREPLPAKPPKAFVDAQARAQKVLDSAQGKLAKLRIHVDMPQSAKATVKVDGESISPAALDADRPVDPGAHHVEASAQGFRAATADTTLKEGATGAVSLKLEADPNAPAVVPAAAGAAGPPGGAPGTEPPPQVGTVGGAPPPGAEARGPSKTMSYVLLGVGGAGVLVGAGFGMIALGKKTSLDNTCGNDKSHCPASAQGDIDSIHSAATGSTIGFVIGGLAAGAGIILLVTAKPTATGDASEHPAHASVHPFIGPSSLGVTGSF
jgi:hypothetical protein